MKHFKDLGVELPRLNTLDDMPEIRAVAKLSNHNGWTWYVIAGDETPAGDVYCYGYVESPLVSEFGFFLLSDILAVGAMFCLTFSGAVIGNPR